MPPGTLPELASSIFCQPRRRASITVFSSSIVRMLSIGLIHGDLSEFNVLIGSEGPVIIDLPQAVNATGNNRALEMLERDVNNLRGTVIGTTPSGCGRRAFRPS
jgi:RIO kinase 1